MKAKSLIILLLLLAAASCSRHSRVSETLAHAEAVMEEHPDSALSILQAVPDSALVTDRDRALHALLLSQALDKNYIDITSDSLINIALDYFRDHNDRYEMLSNYYYAKVTSNAEEYTKSTFAILKAKELSEKIRDTLYIARTCEQLADYYSQNYDFQNDIKLRANVIDAYKKSGKDKNAIYATLDLAIAHTNNKNYLTALKILENIDTTRYKEDSTFMRFYLRAYIKPLNALQRYQDAFSIISKLKQFVKDESKLSIEENCNIANLYMAVNNIDSASYYISNSIHYNANALNNLNLQGILLNIYANTENSAYLTKSYDTILKHQNNLIHEILQNRVMEIEKNYYTQQSKDAQNKLDILHIKFIGGSVLAVLLIILVSTLLILQRQRNLNMRLKLDSSIEQLMKLEESIWSKDTALSEINYNYEKSKQCVNELFHQKFEIINELSAFYNLRKIDSGKATLLYAKINETLEQFCNDTTIKEMESIVDKYQNNIISRFKSLFPDLPPYLNKLVLYTFLGFSPSTMSIFLQTSKSNIYVYKSKIKRIILNSKLDIPKEILVYFDISETSSKHP